MAFELGTYELQGGALVFSDNVNALNRAAVEEEVFRPWEFTARNARAQANAAGGGRLSEDMGKLIRVGVQTFLSVIGAGAGMKAVDGLAGANSAQPQKKTRAAACRSQLED